MSPRLTATPRLRAVPQPRSASLVTTTSGKRAITSSSGRVEPLSTTITSKRSCG